MLFRAQGGEFSKEEKGNHIQSKTIRIQLFQVLNILFSYYSLLFFKKFIAFKPFSIFYNPPPPTPAPHFIPHTLQWPRHFSIEDLVVIVTVIDTPVIATELESH